MHNNYLEEIEIYAKENRVPIMQKDGIEYLCNFIKENNIKSILEIGSAIGYSAIKMALVDDDIMVTTIEKDKNRYDIAINNIKLFDLDRRITIINDDALNTNIDSKYDLLFIDASKGHNIDFLQKYKDNLNESGVAIIDNLSFHGLVEDTSLIQTKNQLKIVEKIKKCIDYLDNSQEFKTEYIGVGDKIAIVRKI